MVFDYIEQSSQFSSVCVWIEIKKTRLLQTRFSFIRQIYYYLKGRHFDGKKIWRTQNLTELAEF